jgi:phage/plasmid-associated DNA primase
MTQHRTTVRLRPSVTRRFTCGLTSFKRDCSSSPILADKDDECPMWKQFVREIMDYKADLIAFLQTAAGWSVSGDTSEQSMFILYGTGANGKSTFLNVIQNILGDYALSTWTKTLLKGRFAGSVKD